MNYDELIPGCSLHHFNLSGIDISLLNNKASKQLLPVHSTWTANPLEVSNLRFKCCARVRGENARLDPRYHIWTPRGCQTKQATVLSDMSLGLHFGCRPFPWCGGLVHLRLARKASATLRKLIWFAIRRAISISGWHVSKLQLNGFRNWCERCKRGVHCRCPPPLSQPKGYRSYLPQMATCPRNNRQLMNLLETNRFEYLHIMMINLVPSGTRVQ